MPCWPCWLLGLAAIFVVTQRSRRRTTERLQAEKELRMAASVFEESPIGIMITDPAGRIQRVNRSFSDITGFSAAEALGQSPRLIKSEHHDQSQYAELWRSLRQEGQWQGELLNRRKTGETYAVWQNIVAVRGADGTPEHYIGMFSDITEKKRVQENLRHLAEYDLLTGLPNRHLFLDRLEHAILRMRRLQACMRESDTLARQGGDEFTLLLEDSSEFEAEAVAEKLIAVLAKSVQLGATEVFVGASIGSARYPEDGAQWPADPPK